MERQRIRPLSLHQVRDGYGTGMLRGGFRQIPPGPREESEEGGEDRQNHRMERPSALQDRDMHAPSRHQPQDSGCGVIATHGRWKDTETGIVQGRQIRLYRMM